MAGAGGSWAMRRKERGVNAGGGKGWIGLRNAIESPSPFMACGNVQTKHLNQQPEPV